MNHDNPDPHGRTPGHSLLRVVCVAAIIIHSGLGVTPARAEGYCPVVKPSTPASVAPSADRVYISADKIHSYSSGSIDLRGHAQLRYKKQRIRANRINYDSRLDRLVAEGDIQYSACPTKDPLWFLNAKRMDGDFKKKELSVRDAWLVFANTPVLKVPSYRLSLDQQRKTGFLTPRVGYSSRSGTSLATPFYFNIAPNYDLEITPQYLSKRGLLNSLLFRALTDYTTGNIHAGFIDDRKYNDKRYFMFAEQQTTFGDYFRLNGSLRRISDEDYEEDIDSSETDIEESYLYDEIDLDYAWRGWRLHASAEGSIRRNDDDVRSEPYPFGHKPHVSLEKNFRSSKLGIETNVYSHYTQFHRKSSSNDIAGTIRRGKRFGGSLEFARPWTFGGTDSGFYLTPSVKLDWTRYSLSYKSEPDDMETGESNTEDDRETRLRRTVPSYRLHGGMLFSRQTPGGRMIHTLEPELKYIYTPERDQSDIPLFDTYLSEFNLAQVLEGNTFNGPDRISDTHQVGVVLNSRLLSAQSGQQIARWSIGKIIGLGNTDVCVQGVNCKTDDTADSPSSDYVGEMELNFNRKMRFISSVLWDNNNDRISRSFTQLNLHGDGDRELNLSYRQRRRDEMQTLHPMYGDATEQIGISLGDNLGNSWTGYTEWQYDLRRKKPLNYKFEMDYNSCCWSMGFFFRRSLVDILPDADGSLALDDGEFDYDSFIGLQFRVGLPQSE